MTDTDRGAPRALDIDRLEVDDYVRTTAGLESFGIYGVWLRVTELARDDDAAYAPAGDVGVDPVSPVVTINGEVSCYPLPEGVENGDVYEIDRDMVLEIVPKADLPGRRLQDFFRYPGPEHDEAFKAEFDALRQQEERAAAPQPEPTNFEEAIEVRLQRYAADIMRLAEFIMQHVPGEPSRADEGAIDCAIRIIDSLQGLNSVGKGMETIRRLLGPERFDRVPGPSAEDERRHAEQSERELAQQLEHARRQLRIDILRMVTTPNRDMAQIIPAAQELLDFAQGHNPVSGAEVVRRGLLPEDVRRLVFTASGRVFLRDRPDPAAFEEPMQVLFIEAKPSSGDPLAQRHHVAVKVGLAIPIFDGATPHDVIKDIGAAIAGLEQTLAQALYAAIPAGTLRTKPGEEAPADWPVGATTPLFPISGPVLDEVEEALEATVNDKGVDQGVGVAADVALTKLREERASSRPGADAAAGVEDVREGGQDGEQR